MNKKILRLIIIGFLGTLLSLFLMTYFDTPKTYYDLGNNFKKDDRNIFYLDQKIKGADFETFEVLDNKFAKDKNTMFYTSNRIEDSDPYTFDVLNEFYAKDKKNVYKIYYSSCKKIEGSDLATFKILDGNYAKDKNYFYFKGSPLNKSSPVNFKYLGDGFAKEGNSIFFEGRIIENSDSESFKYLGSFFSKDKNNVYYKLEMVNKNVDIATFMVLDENYSKDSNNVYYKCKCLDNPDYDIDIIKDADSITFNNLGLGYAKDKNAVYYFGEEINKPDSNSFEYIGGDYSKDKNSVFYYRYKRINSSKTINDDGTAVESYNIESGLEIIDGVDITTFEYLGGNYAKDKDYIYAIDEDIFVIENVDYKTFKLFKRYPDYARDKNYVYYFGKIFQNANPETFEIEDFFVKKDKNYVYISGVDDVIAELDRKTFKKFNRGYFMDKDNCYYGNKKVDKSKCDKFPKKF